MFVRTQYEMAGAIFTRFQFDNHSVQLISLIRNPKKFRSEVSFLSSGLACLKEVSILSHLNAKLPKKIVITDPSSPSPFTISYGGYRSSVELAKRSSQGELGG